MIIQIELLEKIVIMKYKNKILFSIFVFLFCSNLSKAQISDVGNWSNLTIQKELKFDLKLSLSEEIRFYENLSKFDEFFTEADAEYKITN